MAVLKGFRIMSLFLLTVLISYTVADPPYPPSPVIDSISWDFDNAVRKAAGSDLWPPTWGTDDNIYIAWGDGGGFGGADVGTGFARIKGGPAGFTTDRLWTHSRTNHWGYVNGLIAVGPTLYATVYEENNSDITRIAWSADNGQSWTKSSWSFPGGSGNFFPHSFLNFGKGNADARDDFVYVYGRKWGVAQHAYLARVPKSGIDDKSQWEFFSGQNGSPSWSSNAGDLQPVFSDPNSSRPAIAVSYNQAIRRYILTMPHGGPGRLGVFDGPEPWGPWTTAGYYDGWGGYSNSGSTLYWHFPTKWISGEGKTMWCIFSATGVLDSYNQVKATVALKTTHAQMNGPRHTNFKFSIQPNPFTSTAKIILNRAVPMQNMEIGIYSMNGRLVERLTGGLSWTAGNEPAGYYVVRMTSPQGAYNKAITLLK
jgi:hypothetical protein